MTGTEEGRPIRIGAVLFDPMTGEIRGAEFDGGSTTRLPPKPARLLELLVEKRGELATRDEIKQLLWPETYVDFDQSTSFCVRQIRSAFRDAGGESSYVETLPRRGYRLTEPIVPVDDLPSSKRPAPWPLLAFLAAIAGLVGMAAVMLTSMLGPRPPARLAIMPFELAAGEVGLSVDAGLGSDLARASERLLAEASRRWPEHLEVIGPRSTAAYSSFPFPDLQALGSDLDIDYVLNARILEREGRPQLLVELIRLADGAHPWVHYFPRAADAEGIVGATLAGVADALELPDT